MGDTMHSPRPNVLPLFDPPRQKSYRVAVANIIRKVKARHELSNVTLAERIGCCAETIGNAENENTDLNAATLARIGYEFGPDAVQPFVDLFVRRYEAPRTLFERLDDALADLDAVRREMGDGALAA